MLRCYWTAACSNCSLNSQCTTEPERRIARREVSICWKLCSSALMQTQSLSVLAYNLTRVMNTVGIKSLVAAIAA
jgi:positive regulator of sigma E activity